MVLKNNHQLQVITNKFNFFFPLIYFQLSALLNNLNGKKERTRTHSKKEENHDGFASGTVSRCSSPEPIKEVRAIDNININ